MPGFSEVSLLVVFTDLTRYTALVERLDDAEVARGMDAYYELAGSAVESGGGRVVKFIGDAMLAVFPEESADRGVVALLGLKDAADRFMETRGWECRLVLKAHFGPVVAGQFGTGSDKRYDVLGKTVNATARLKSSGVALSVEAFLHLGPEARQLFKKDAPPGAYTH